MTPLEEQVRRHKPSTPGLVLLIEVGYKFHFYGEDARVAAKTLNIFAYQSRNYLTASVPVPPCCVLRAPPRGRRPQGGRDPPDRDRRAESRGGVRR